MTASNELVCFPVWPLPETAMGLPTTRYESASWVSYHTTIPLVRSKGSSPRTNDLHVTRPSVAATAKKKKNEKSFQQGVCYFVCLTRHLLYHSSGGHQGQSCRKAGVFGRVTRPLLPCGRPQTEKKTTTEVVARHARRAQHEPKHAAAQSQTTCGRLLRPSLHTHDRSRSRSATTSCRS